MDLEDAQLPAGRHAPPHSPPLRTDQDPSADLPAPGNKLGPVAGPDQDMAATPCLSPHLPEP